ncbi:MAG: DUF1257 domain-containing protein [Candidatus Melainabacteria bacterium]|nr:DUF1257 domain-containing protein [Candidatus Melainabacteria bacterium]
MSHFSIIKTQVTDIEILAQSLNELGMEIKFNSEIRGHNGLKIQAEIVAILPGHYDIGWSKNPDGTYDLIADLWGISKQHNQQELINSINQRFAVNKTIQEIQKSGYKINEQSVKEDGTVTLVIAK